MSKITKTMIAEALAENDQYDRARSENQVFAVTELPAEEPTRRLPPRPSSPRSRAPCSRGDPGLCRAGH
jgi:hypothetical protein